MIRTLEDAIEFARAADTDSVALFVLDWSEVVAQCDRLELGDAAELERWRERTSSPALELAPLLRVRYASEATLEGSARDPLASFEASLCSALLAQGLPTTDDIAALLRGDPVELPLVLGRRQVVTLHRPRRASPYTVALLAELDESLVERALQRSEARYRAIVQDQTDFIVRYRADGVRTFVNDAYARFFGGRPEKLIGTTFVDLVAPEHVAQVLDKHRRLLAGEAEVLTDEHLAIRHDGVACWTHWVDRAIHDERGNLVELQAVGRDISERKATEERLARAQKMEALGVLAGGLAHDFNNTLAGVVGLAELITSTPNDPSRVVSFAEGILEATERAAELTRSLLRLSRRAPLRLDACNVAELVESTARLLRATIRSEVRVTTQLAPLPSVRADASQLTQALLNLGLNARDAITGPGTIELSARVEQQDERELLILRVTDDGAGIPEHVRPHLFEPFFTTKPDGEGTGLGLAMVYACARAHGGRVEFCSELGVGTRIELIFPLVRAEPTPTAPREPEPDVARTVLVVDDDPMVRLHVRMVLERAGHVVLTASDKHDALARHGERIAELDLVVTGMVMANGSGRELEQELHRMRPELPIVLLTAGLSEHGRRGFAAVLEKPVVPDELLRSLDELFGR